MAQGGRAGNIIDAKLIELGVLNQVRLKAVMYEGRHIYTSSFELAHS